MSGPAALDDLHEAFLAQVNEAIDRLTFGAAQRPARAPGERRRPHYDRIVVAYDASDGAKLALEWAKDLALAHRSKVTTVGAFTAPTVSSPASMGYAWYPDYAEAYVALEEGARAAAAKAAEALRSAGIQAASEVVAGSPGREIAHVAERSAADLVVVGAARENLLKRAFLGSTARALLDRAPCSVLIARGPPRPTRILVAADGSHTSYRAVAHALHRASATGAELVVQHVLEYPALSASDAPPEGFVKAVVERLELPAPPPKVRYVLDVGHPAGRILARAQAEDVGLVVLGSQGKHAVERLVVGSTSRHVADAARASVLVVR